MHLYKERDWAAKTIGKVYEFIRNENFNIYIYTYVIRYPMALCCRD